MPHLSSEGKADTKAKKKLLRMKRNPNKVLKFMLLLAVVFLPDLTDGKTQILSIYIVLRCGTKTSSIMYPYNYTSKAMSMRFKSLLYI